MDLLIVGVFCFFCIIAGSYNIKRLEVTAAVIWCCLKFTEENLCIIKLWVFFFCLLQVCDCTYKHRGAQSTRDFWGFGRKARWTTGSTSQRSGRTAAQDSRQFKPQCWASEVTASAVSADSLNTNYQYALSTSCWHNYWQIYNAKPHFPFIFSKFNVFKAIVYILCKYKANFWMWLVTLKCRISSPIS